MNTRLSLTYTLDAAPEQLAGMRQELELSLPCINCQRSHRTVFFTKNKSVCTPKDKCSGFMGTLDSINIEIIYNISFEYSPFIDQKYGEPSDLEKHRWARIYFTLKCPACGKKTEFFSQSNLGRPRDIKCNCGHCFAVETEDPFTFSYSWGRP